jgi:hypothetical protein
MLAVAEVAGSAAAADFTEADFMAAGIAEVDGLRARLIQ